ncbi:hypothetical protein ABT336_17530, partial [Micromonospora sp. NPDC000207]|uniref:hypothetical protein n=1 Tax=Micromonospora sp. NPDC000207 TaxID=3154246 RepID=UPI0033266AC8
AAPRQVAALTGLLHRALDARRERLTPLAIVVTKADLVDFHTPAVRARLREPFAPIMDAVSRTLHVQGAFMLVSCGPLAIGVRVPALWMLHLGILNRALELATPGAATPGADRGETARIRPLVEPAERLGDLLTHVQRF